MPFTFQFSVDHFLFGSPKLFTERKRVENDSAVDGDGEGGWIMFVYSMNIAGAFIKMYK